MNEVLMLGGNPRSKKRIHGPRKGKMPTALARYWRKKTDRRRTAKTVTVYRNPRKGGFLAGGIVKMILGDALPFAGGVTVGLIVPKIFLKKLPKNVQRLIVVAAGVALPTLAGRFVGRRLALLAGAGMISAVILDLVDDLWLNKSPIGGNLKDESGDTVDLFADGAGAAVSDERDPSMADEDDPSMADEDDGTE